MLTDEPPLWRKFRYIAIVLIASICLSCVPNKAGTVTETPEVRINLLDVFELSGEDKQQIIFRLGKSNYEIEQERIEEENRVEEARRGGSPGLVFDSNAVIIGDDTKYRDKKGKSNCVIFATKFTGISKRLGYGVTIRSEGQEPKVGAIALGKGHAMVVREVESDYLTIWDTNWVKGKITQRRVSRSSIRGYVY